MDYDTKVGTAYVNGEFYLAHGWTLSVDGAYTMSQASFDPIHVPVPDEAPWYEDFDFSAVNTYSDLDYAQFEVSSRLTKDISPRASVYVGGGYFGLQDNEAYVYGDMTGSVLYTQSGVQVRF